MLWFLNDQYFILFFVNICYFQGNNYCLISLLNEKIIKKNSSKLKKEKRKPIKKSFQNKNVGCQRRMEKLFNILVESSNYLVENIFKYNHIFGTYLVYPRLHANLKLWQ